MQGIARLPPTPPRGHWERAGSASCYVVQKLLLISVC